MPDFVSQKTVSRKITMSCGHQQRVRIDVPSDRMFTRRQFDEWTAHEFEQRATNPCPTCRSIEQARELDGNEADLLGPVGVALTRFDSEPLAVATFARSIRFIYLRALSERLHAETPGWDHAAYAILAGWLSAGETHETSEVRTKRIHTAMSDLVFRYLSERSNEYRARYWISNKQQMTRNADRDAHNPVHVLPALLVALAGLSDPTKSYAAYMSLLREGTEDDFDLSSTGANERLPLAEVLGRVVFLRALGTEPGGSPVR